MATALGALQDPRDVLIHGVRRHKDHFSGESSNKRRSRLLDRRPRPQGRFDGKRMSLLDVELDEMLALIRYGATNVARNRTVAAQKSESIGH